MLWVLFGAATIATVAIAAARHAEVRPAQRGLVVNAWYRLLLRSSFNRETFGDTAAMQAQALLGRQGFDVRRVDPDPVDPFVYRASGAYRGGTDGMLFDSPGLLILGRADIEPLPDRGTIAHVDARPVALEPGARYFGRASISWPLSMLVTSARVIDKLKAEGFENILVIEDAKELPPDWPSAERGGDLFVAATYRGAARTMAVPSQIVSVWTAEG